MGPYSGNKRNKTLANILCPGKFMKSGFPNLTSTFKRRRTSEGPHLRNPLMMTYVRYENSTMSSSISKKRDSIPRKYLSKKHIGIFRFGQPETQTQIAFVCMMTSENKLSSEAPEFVLVSLEEKCFQRFLENDLRKTYKDHF